MLAGAVARFVTIQNAALKLTWAYAPAIGFVMALLSAVWGLWWRGKLRREFRRDYSINCLGLVKK